MKLLKKHEIHIITDNTDDYDAKRLDKITPAQIETHSFTSRTERKAYLAGLAVGLEHRKARLLTLHDVELINDMSELSHLQSEIAGIQGVA